MVNASPITSQQLSDLLIPNQDYNWYISQTDLIEITTHHGSPAEISWTRGVTSEMKKSKINLGLLMNDSFKKCKTVFW